MSDENSLKLYTQLEENIFSNKDVTSVEIEKILSLK
jgi:hypothetical protein